MDVKNAQMGRLASYVGRDSSSMAPTNAKSVRLAVARVMDQAAVSHVPQGITWAALNALHARPTSKAVSCAPPLPLASNAWTATTSPPANQPASFVGTIWPAVSTATAAPYAPTASQAFTSTLLTTTAPCAKSHLPAVRYASRAVFVLTVKMDISWLAVAVQVVRCVPLRCRGVFRVPTRLRAKCARVAFTCLLTTSARRVSAPIAAARHAVPTPVEASYVHNAPPAFTKTPLPTYACPVQTSAAQSATKPTPATAWHAAQHTTATALPAVDATVSCKAVTSAHLRLNA